jgi:hypothetical protein
MYATAEVRWFGRGPALAAVRTWFDAGPLPPRPEPARRDHYLKTGSADIGIKLRGGKLEVKRRLESRGPIECAPGIVGRLELWRKWSMALDAAASPVADLMRPARFWLTTEKRRRRRAFALDAAGVMVEVQPPEMRPEPPEVGCDLELTELAVGREQWWTLGFEAFGAGSDLAETLLMTTQAALAASEGLALAPDTSLGYAAWLTARSG